MARSYSLLSRRAAIVVAVAGLLGGGIAAAPATAASISLVHGTLTASVSEVVFVTVVDPTGAQVQGTTVTMTAGVAQDFDVTIGDAVRVSEPLRLQVKVQDGDVAVAGGWYAGDGQRLALDQAGAQAFAVGSSITADLVDTTTVSGTVTNGDRAVGSRVVAEGEGSQFVPQTYVDDEGQFDVRGVDPRVAYRLWLDAGPDHLGGWITADGRTSDWEDDASWIRDGRPSSVAITVDAPVTISGRFRSFDGPLETVTGRPRLNVTVWERRAGETDTRTWFGGTVERTGEVVLTGLRAGSSYVICGRYNQFAYGVEDTSAPGCYAGPGNFVVPAVGDATAVTAPSSTFDAVVLRPDLWVGAALPDLVGDAVVGSTLRLSAPMQWKPSGVTTDYRWLRDGVEIPDATGTRYDVQPADLGKHLTVNIRGSAFGYEPHDWELRAWPEVVGMGEIPAPSREPVLTSKAQVGRVLTVDPGTWISGSSLSYRWLTVEGKVVAGVRTASFVVPPALVGHSLVVEVTATAPGRANRVVTVVTPAPVAPGVLTATVAPRLAGTAVVGHRLTASPGVWPSGTTITYGWRNTSIARSGTSSPTYDVGLADVGKRVSVTVTVKRAGYATYTRTLTTATVPKVKPGLTAKLSATKVSHTKRVSVAVRVTGQSGPSGKVTVTYGKKHLTTTLKTSGHGKVSVRLPTLKKGTYKVTVTFAPTGSSAHYLTSRKVTAHSITVR